MWCKVACMNDRDDFAELIGSARTVIKCPSFYFNGRIRYGTKGEKVEERLLCMDAVRVYICSVKIPVKIESQFNILSIKLIERVTDSHILIETDEKQAHTLYGVHDKSSLQPFLIVLVRSLHAVFPHRLQAIVEIRPENEYDKLLRLSNEFYQDPNIMSTESRPCGGFSQRYECACDFYQIPCNRAVQTLVDTVFAHRTSREFTFREFESLTQKDWLPIIGALRHNEWFTKITIENIKLTSENIDELCTFVRLCKAVQDLRLINCGLRHDFCTRFTHSLPVCHIEKLDLSNNALEDKGLIALSSSLQQRKLPLISINLQSCSLTHKSLLVFNTAIINNNNLLKNLQILNLSGNRIKEENCITILFQNNDNVLEELHLSDIEFNLESFFNSMSSISCKLRRLFISSIKSFIPPSVIGGVKSFFMKTETLEIVQLSNANLSNEFLKELCDGLHSNIHLNNLDLRLSGNQLETFIHENAAKLATIPSLTALDLTACDLDNEIPTLLGELKKNRKIKSLHIGKNFNNIKQKNMQRTISAMKDLVIDSDLEYLSIADSKLKENTIDFLLALTYNASLKILDIRGNLMGDTGARVITHIIQINRQLHTLFFDRNLLSFNSFEDIVNAMEENYTIQYLPIPITDIILMKITEKDRMEKIQILMNKLDSICTRNQQQRENLNSNDSSLLTTAANLSREINLSWENQQQLVGDQASLDYISSCSNRILQNSNNDNNTNNELNSILTRTTHINKISSQLYESYIEEEEHLKNEWDHICKTFQEKVAEKNERLSRKYYQLFKEQTSINYDDKFQEQIRAFFSNANDNIEQLLRKDITNRLLTYSRQCYINVATCLQKRAYDTINDVAVEMHKQMETAMLHTNVPQQGSLLINGQNSVSSSTLDRNMGRNSNTSNRLTPKHNPTSVETNDETLNHRTLKKTDSNECIIDSSPQQIHSTARTSNDKEHRLSTTIQTKGPVPISPKPTTSAWRTSLLVISNEQESNSNISDPIYGNVQTSPNTINRELSFENEGDLIEHDLLDLVEQEKQKEEQRNAPPALPIKTRTGSLTTTKDNNNLDFDIEPTTKLTHPGKERPRRANVKRPIKRPANVTANDSSSDGGLLTDENEDNSIEDIVSKPIIEVQGNFISAVEPQITELPSTSVTKFLKSALKTPKPVVDEPSPSSTATTPLKNLQQFPIVLPRPVPINSMSKSMIMPNNDQSPIINSDLSNESFPTKTSMSTSLYSSLIPPNPNEQKDINNSTESIISSVPPVLARTGKVAIGTRVLPVLDPNGDAPPVRLRHFQAEKKGHNASIDNTTTTSEVGSGSTADSSVVSPSISNNGDHDEQYKRLSVKERARMLTTNSPMAPNDKKTILSSHTTTTTSSQTPPYTPRTYRRIIEQVNLFC
ncbi:unnamed protein product [Rotaria socialis]|uniref:CARMIL pleckstrin homology domain-containing protein n=4 Tax=Rotaria socialis TaxID=392032 RepID=A0A817MCH2_9BILA|nr:unnamed protein product [Rotaria socialis]CAF3381479.1 unnamed protein product [Rotaria socialis]CAF3487632.1 unnamed protein product [Rotaria socialis]CAF3673944.1 unnamed protein product [Rotaria socialis]CAF4202352.1 unnamed protein product [Rotaria socialis]